MDHPVIGCGKEYKQAYFPSSLFREKYQDGESASPYVFVCKNHQELLVKFPMSGQHKIYKLDPQIHQAAKKSVKRRSGAPERLLTDLTDAMAPWRNQSGAA